MKIPLPILFALGTALCWGLYGPTLGNARSPEKLWSPFKPYVGIGLAYIVWACIGGMVAMKISKDTFSFGGTHSAALTWGFAAGTLGALGALSLTAAMLSFAGKPRPELVMPVVFGGAVTVAALVSIITHRGTKTSPLLWVGMLMVAVGIILVASKTPHGAPPHKPAVDAESAAQVSTEPATALASPPDETGRGT